VNNRNERRKKHSFEISRVLCICLYQNIFTFSSHQKKKENSFLSVCTNVKYTYNLIRSTSHMHYLLLLELHSYTCCAHESTQRMYGVIPSCDSSYIHYIWLSFSSFLYTPVLKIVYSFSWLPFNRLKMFIFRDWHLRIN
jgi:hypothetical protein